MGGEGIVLKERTSLYRPGVRSPAWLKLTLGAVALGIVTGLWRIPARARSASQPLREERP